MKSNRRPTPFPFPLLGSLGLAALGQFFLIQRDQPWTAWVGCGFYGLAVFFFLRAMGKPGQDPAPTKPLAPRLEALLFLLILAVAAFFRLYRLDQFPAGIFADEACLGWGALRILHEGWRPFYDLYHLSVWDQPLYYLLALWFKFFSLSRVNFFLFSVFFSLLALPLVYWTFRQWAGPRAALAALFLLAVMRWHVIYSRDGHPALHILFYMFGTLAFWTWGRESGKRWALWVAGAFMGAGFYAYQAYLAFPLLMAAGLFYEWSIQKGRDKNPPVRDILGLLLITLFLTAPLWIYALGGGSSLTRQKELFLFPGLPQRDGPLGLLKHLLETALMFNREGDPWYLHNIPGHRMLDDVTGILMVLGLALGLSRAGERKFFYPLAGLFIMALPSFLSMNAAHASRAFGTIPFACFLAALAVLAIWDRVRGWKPVLFLPWAVLGLAAFLNFNAYFMEQANNVECWKNPSTDATAVGSALSREGDRFDDYLAPHFFGRFSILFLGYSQRDHTRELRIPESLPLIDSPSSRGAFFALEEGQTGLLNLLRDLYPGGESEYFRDLQGHSLVYFYRVPPGQNRQGARNFSRSSFGLRGTYRTSLDEKVLPVLTRVDPLLNFTSLEDFTVALQAPFSIHWRGSLLPPVAGPYRFLALTTDQALLTLDDKPVLTAGNTESSDLFLGVGPHRVEVHFLKSSGTDAAFSLLWKTPGAVKFEVVPFQAYRTGPRLQGPDPR